MSKFRFKETLLLTAYFAFITSVVFSVLNFGWTKTWEFFQLPSLNPNFIDLRAIQGSLLSEEQGFNPQIKNPYDPLNRIWAYPKIWLQIANLLNLGNEINFLYFVSFIVVMFIILSAYLIYKYKSTYLFLFFLSGSTLFAIERGNVDLIIFIILFFASVGNEKLKIGLILLGFSLKIFPIFALVSVKLKKNNLIIALLVFFVATLFLLPQVNVIRNEANFGFYPPTYGLKNTIFLISEFSNDFSTFYSVNPKTINFFISIIWMTYIFYHLRKYLNSKLINNFLEHSKKLPKELTLFLIGGSIYCGTFLLSSNFDYKQIFLAFCIPLFTKTIKEFKCLKFLPLLFLVSSNIFLEWKLAVLLNNLVSTEIPLVSFVVLVNQLSKISIFVILFYFQVVFIATKIKQLKLQVGYKGDYLNQGKKFKRL